MQPVTFALASPLALLVLWYSAPALGETRVSLDDALRAAERMAPELLVARARESVAQAEVGVAGVYANPSVSAASNTQTAKIAGTASIPLIILGQRGASIDAARADQRTVALDTLVVWNDVRQAIEQAYTALWLFEGVVEARRESAAIEAALEAAVAQRVEVGSAPQIDSLRIHAERLRADADVLEATAQVTAAGSAVGRWMGIADGSSLRSTKTLAVPDSVPPLDTLRARLEASAPVRREQSDVRAAEARAQRERALVRPAITLDVGFDALDPTIADNATNYRAQLTFEVPIFQQRGAYVDRERALGDVARSRVRAALTQASAELTASYLTFEAATVRQRTLADAVVPAAQAAAKATEDAYTLGRAPLVAVLDAQRALVDARVSALEAQAARAVAWANVEHAVGGLGRE